MAVATHDSKWRLPLAAAPVFVVVSFVWAALLGERGAIDSPLATTLLGIAAALGALIAAPRIGGAREHPAATVAQARMAADRTGVGEPVVLRGHARPLPDAGPLVSPGGELCLWFARDGSATGEVASERPFLLVDRTGACIVLPAGARVTRGAPLAAEGQGAAGVRGDVLAPFAHERLLRAGDRLEVRGCIVPAPSQRWDPRTGLPEGAGLPVVAAAGAPAGLVIVIEAAEGWRALYGALAFVDTLVAIVAGGLATWPMLVRF